MPYYAHSARNPDGSPAHALFQPLADHLRGVAGGARDRAAATGVPGLAVHAAAAGLLHDLGKYRPGFQRYIHPDYPDPPLPDRLHKEAGAARAAAAKCGAVAFAIFGHHGGLPDLANLQSGIKTPAADWQGLWTAAVADLPELATALDGLPPVPRDFAADLFTRVLFACLVDADWADTSRHEQQTRGRPTRPRRRSTRPPGWGGCWRTSIPSPPGRSNRTSRPPARRSWRRAWTRPGGRPACSR